jgi:beta-lactamase superfamily II metal-dependent hydrolase
MAIEIDMTSVGNGDAIVLRCVWANGRSFVAVIDGGYESDGDKIVATVRQRYRTDYVDLVVSTHPDHDHIAGLNGVVRNVRVGMVWAHDPGRHVIGSTLKEVLRSYRAFGSGEFVTRSFDDLQDFLGTVDRLGISRTEPFSEMQCGPLFVLGPSIDFYEAKLMEMAAEEGLVTESRLMKEQEALSDGLLETDYAIDENDETSPMNDTSTILLLRVEDRKYLFTGDAGVQSINDSRRRWIFDGIHWLDVPHHGSRRNLNSDLVRYLSPEVAYVSAEGTRKHPSRAAVNALKRQGAQVYSTHKSGSLWHHIGADIHQRPDYVAAEPL